MRDPFQFQEEEIVRDEFTRDSAHRALHAAVRELDEMRWRRNQSISEIELPNYAELERRLAGIFGETKKKEPEPELRGLWPAKSPLIKKAANA